MWLYPIVAALVVVGIAGGFLFGGIFTIVLIPIALIVLVGGLLSAASGRAAQAAGGADTEQKHTTDEPLPHSFDGDGGRAPTSPERLADARRAHQ
jgi:hypothetical protein